MDWDFDGSSVITPSQLYAEKEVPQENPDAINPDASTEGFVCPECMLDCYSPKALRAHYDTLHKNPQPSNENTTTTTTTPTTTTTTTPLVSTENLRRSRSARSDEDWEMVIEPGDFDESLQIHNCGASSKKHNPSSSFWSKAGNFSFTKAPPSTTITSTSTSPATSTTSTSISNSRKAVDIGARDGTDDDNQPNPLLSTLNTATNTFVADGVVRSQTKTFGELRKTSCCGRRSHLQLIVRCEKLREVYSSNTRLGMMLHQSKLEQSVVRWQPDGYIKGKCDNCQSSLREKGQDNCRLCGLMFCVDCLCNVNVSQFGIKTSQVIDPNASAFFSGAGVTICTGTCVSVALPLIPIDDARSTQQLTKFHNSLIQSRSQISQLITAKHPLLVKAEMLLKTELSKVTKLISQICGVKFKSERNRKIQRQMVEFGKTLLMSKYQVLDSNNK